MITTRDENILLKALNNGRFFVAKYLLDEKVNITGGWVYQARIMQSFECFQPYYTQYKHYQRQFPEFAVTHSQYLQEAVLRGADPQVFPFLCTEFRVEGEIYKHLQTAVVSDQKQNIKFIATSPYRYLSSFVTQKGPNRRIVFSMQHHLTRQLNRQLTNAHCKMAETLVSLGASVEDPSLEENTRHRNLGASSTPTSVTEFIEPKSKFLPRAERWDPNYPIQSAQLVIAYGAKFDSIALKSVRMSFADAKTDAKWLDDNIRTYQSLPEDNEAKLQLEKLHRYPLDLSRRTRMDESKLPDNLSLFRGLIIRNNLHHEKHAEHFQRRLTILTPLLIQNLPIEIIRLIVEYFPTPRVRIAKHLLPKDEPQPYETEIEIKGVGFCLFSLLDSHQDAYKQKCFTQSGKLFNGTKPPPPREIAIAENINQTLAAIPDTLDKNIAGVRFILAILMDETLKIYHADIYERLPETVKVHPLYRNRYLKPCDAIPASSLEESENFLMADLKDQMVKILKKLKIPKDKLNLSVDALIEELKPQSQLAPDHKLQKLNPKFQTF